MEFSIHVCIIDIIKLTDLEFPFLIIFNCFLANFDLKSLKFNEKFMNQIRVIKF